MASNLLAHRFPARLIFYLEDGGKTFSETVVHVGIAGCYIPENGNFHYSVWNSSLLKSVLSHLTSNIS
jgi:hypothetical protein